MKIERAIEILESRAGTHLSLYNWEDKKAAALGVEALKRLEEKRKEPEFDHGVLLPGETEK